MTTDGLRDRLELNLLCVEPEFVTIEHTVSEDAEFLNVDVSVIDEGDSLSSAVAVIVGIGTWDLELSDGNRSAHVEIPLADLDSGEYGLEVSSGVTGHGISTGELTFSFSREVDKDLVTIHPGDGANVYDHMSVVIAYYAPEIRDIVSDVEVWLDDRDVTNEVIIYTDGIIFLPTELYSDGEHRFMVRVELTDGRVIEKAVSFTVMGMDEI